MRAVELVRRAEQHVDVPGRDVDLPVRAVVDGVGPGECPDAVRKLDDPTHVGRGADRVGRNRERDHARALAELRGEAVVVEREVVVDLDLTHHDPDVVLQRQPGGDVAVVVEPGHEHLVARLQLAGQSPGEEEVERGHALAEGDLVARAAEERSGLLMGEIDEGRGPAGRLVRRPDVRVVVAHVLRDWRRSPRRGTGCRRGRRRKRGGAAAR